jgi:uncharacterized protein YlxW (UPF0749 family)
MEQHVTMHERLAKVETEVRHLGARYNDLDDSIKRTEVKVDEMSSTTNKVLVGVVVACIMLLINILMNSSTLAN